MAAVPTVGVKGLVYATGCSIDVTPYDAK